MTQSICSREEISDSIIDHYHHFPLNHHSFGARSVYLLIQSPPIIHTKSKDFLCVCSNKLLMKFSRLNNFIKFDSNRSVALDSEIIKVARGIKSNAGDVYEPFQLSSSRAEKKHSNDVK